MPPRAASAWRPFNCQGLRCGDFRHRRQPAQTVVSRIRSGVHHVLDSRSLDFAERILDITRGDGVDVVLNSLSGEFIARVSRFCARAGVSSRSANATSGRPEQAAHLRPDVFYDVFDLAAIMSNPPEVLRPMFDLISSGLRAGRTCNRCRPRSFHMEAVVGALRFMQQARHIGKIVIQQPNVGRREVHRRTGRL